MDNSDKVRFALLLGEVFTACQQNTKIDDALISVYWRQLKDHFDIDDLAMVATYLMRTSRFAPSVAEFFIAERKMNEPSVAEAIEIVNDVISQRRPDRGSGFPAIDRAVQMFGGYREIGRSTDKGSTFWVSAFRKAYEDALEEQVAEQTRIDLGLIEDSSMKRLA